MIKMYRLEVRQASCSHKEYMQKKQHQLGPASSYINIKSTKYLFFLLFSRFQNRAPEAQGLEVSCGSKFVFQLEPKRKKSCDWRTGLE